MAQSQKIVYMDPHLKVLLGVVPPIYSETTVLPEKHLRPSSPVAPQRLPLFFHRCPSGRAVTRHLRAKPPGPNLLPKGTGVRVRTWTSGRHQLDKGWGTEQGIFHPQHQDRLETMSQEMFGGGSLFSY